MPLKFLSQATFTKITHGHVAIIIIVRYSMHEDKENYQN